ncbi:hypothetical protein GQ43DRAFT_427246 [Delitschia confertaspora ATCC 74209]|uniref:ribonuclease T1 n=1 Tax=Delitschia confertaspora ATCC 74209 TaxID=1513339 RepID=A0A9P4JD43_9PLEO|nr:hypothetical protein GQ43DRAFT_427246 [Delitschia confertaspora ATCC 74209]
MHSINSLYALALVLVAGSIQASPIAETTDQFAALDRRAIIDCGEAYRFTSSAQDKGYNDAIAHLDAGTTVTGSNGKKYPEYYGDQPAVAGIPASCKENYNDLQIYPVFVGSSTFADGSNPGPDRVVISRHTDGTRERCGLITHRGADSGQFKFCGI